MKYFSIAELIRSETAAAQRIDNMPPAEVVANLTALIDEVLDRVRERWGRPIRVNSGYRSKAVNDAVGSKDTSQHRTGEAADITTGSPTENAKLFALIKGMRAAGEIDFDQLIDEKGFSWVHISHKRNGGNRGQILKIA